MKIEIAAVAEVDRIWPTIAKDIQDACTRSPDPLTAGELWQMCRGGGAFLFLVHDGETVFSASVLRFEGDALRVWCMTGRNMHGWFKDYFNLVKRIALENGAKRLLARGRKGWIRLCGGHVNGDDYEVKL